MVCEPGFEVCDVRCGAFLTRRAAGDGITPPDLSLNAVEVADTLHALFGNRCRAGAGVGDLDQLAPGVRSIESQPDIGADPIRGEQPVVANIAVDLEHAAEVL
jgi:hypothetical protein